MIYKLLPAYKDYLWGGTRLKDEYGKHADSPIIAESWELSCHKDGVTMLEGTDISLPQYLQQNPSVRGTVCNAFDEFPVLIKLIDAAKDLSVQVHPNDAYAKAHEGQLGKTEMWYIVDCQPGAFLYYGFAQEISAHEFVTVIQTHTLCEKLNRVEVKKGNVFFIEAGTIHAIGTGCLIAEVQENSNVTYRVYDYGRLGPDGKLRELHVKKACEVTKLQKTPTVRSFGKHLAQCRYFTVDLMQLQGKQKWMVGEESFSHFLVLSGEMRISSNTCVLHAQKGDSVFADANTGCLQFEGQGELLVTYVEKTAAQN